MKNHCGTIGLVLLVIFIFSFNSYATAQGMPWLSLLLKTDYGDYLDSDYLDKVPTSSTTIIGNFYTIPSSFALKITNNSTRTFKLTRAELRNGSSVIDFTIDRARLSNGLLTPGEFVNVVFSIFAPVPVEGTKFIYYFVDQTGSSFTVSHEY
ncbi:hypothetical protein [Desulfocastanea catecholica]